MELIKDLELATNNLYSTRAITSSNYPLSSWKNKRDISLLNGRSYEERVNLISDYYDSPAFMVDVPNNSALAGKIIVNFDSLGVTETKSIQTDVYYRTKEDGKWEKAISKNFGYNIMIDFHYLETSSITGAIDRICLRMFDVNSNYSTISGTSPKLFTYTISQV